MTKAELIAKLTEIRDQQLSEESYFNLDQVIAEIERSDKGDY